MLVFGRVGGLLLALPLFNAQGVPKYIPVFLSVLLSLIITPLLPPVATPPTLGILLMGVASEMAVGVLLGGIVAAVFGAFSMACETMAMQMGFGMASLFDPLQKTSTGALGTLASWLAGMVFLATGLHLHCVELVAESFTAVPPGSLPNLLAAGPVVIQTVAESIAVAGRLAGPVLALVWMVNVFVAVLTRLAPRMNVYFSMGTILTSCAGLALFAIALPNMVLAHSESIVVAVGWLEVVIEAIRG